MSDFITLYKPTESEIKELLIIAGLAFDAVSTGNKNILNDYMGDLSSDLWDFLCVQSPYLVETLKPTPNKQNVADR